MTPEAILREIDAAIAPPMSQEDALDFLNHIVDELELRIDGLKSDLGQ